jgi:hypothetical protein
LYHHRYPTLLSSDSEVGAAIVAARCFFTPTQKQDNCITFYTQFFCQMRKNTFVETACNPQGNCSVTIQMAILLLDDRVSRVVLITPLLDDCGQGRILLCARGSSVLRVIPY